MGIVVDHEKRKKTILKKALDVFVDEGYEDATFQKIANKCGITRTTLYIYFKNKREIFLWSIKQLAESLETAIQKVINDETKTYSQKLVEMMDCIFQKCVENKELFGVILAYLLQVKKAGKDPNVKVRRRIVRLRHLMSTVLIAGKKAGEFRNINVKAANDLLYSLIESAVFKLAILDQKEIDEMIFAVQLAVGGISLEKITK